MKNISRRDFIRRSTAGAAALAMAPLATIVAQQPNTQGPIVWAKNAPAFKFHMVGHAHIDPVWLWPWREGISVVHSTFRSALDRMNENPEFIFTCSQMQFYAWVAENDPEMLKEIRKRVTEGRWIVVGGWWVEPDINMPSGEALARQGLYGQLLLDKLVGKRATVGFNPDSFGHTQSLPQILKLQGMDKYVFMRPGPHEKEIPSDLFWWEGPDGSRVLTYRIQESYNDSRSVENRLKKIMEKGDKQPMKTFMAYYGVGDHGGGPTKENLRSIDEIMKQKGAPKLAYSSPVSYFAEVESDKSIKIPIIKDDLQHHAVGCYTSEIYTKKGNRLSEAALVCSEKVLTIGSKAWNVNYPKEKLTDAWKKVLFLQFHDSAAGSSLAEHTTDLKEGYGYAMDIARENMYMGLQKLEWQIASEDPESEYLVIFNPHGWEVKQPLEYDLGWNRMADSIRVDDENGNPMPYQWTIGQSVTGGRKTLIAEITVPPMGYRQIRIHKGESPALPRPAKAEGNTMENEFYKITFSADGTMGILDKETGKEVFAGGTAGCKGVIIEDMSDTWGHAVRHYDKMVGAFGNGICKVLENGPLRACTRVISKYGKSTLSIDWRLYAGNRNIEAKVTLDWHEKHKMLKFSFPIDVENPTPTYETAYGFITRKATGEEDPGQRWIDVSGKRGGSEYGFTLFNDAKYGYDVKDNDMRVSIVRGTPFAWHDPTKLDPNAEYPWMDQGLQTMTMWLKPHKGGWKEANVIRTAEQFIMPLIPIYQGIHRGTMPKSGSFLSVDNPAVVVTSLKHSEIGDDIIVRVVEMLGSEAKATVNLAFLNKKWTGTFRGCEIKTLRISSSGNIKEVNLLEE